MRSFLLISNTEIVAISIWLLFTILILTAYGLRDRLKSLLAVITGSKLSMPLLLVIQAALIFLFPAYRSVVITYLFLFLSGITLYLFVVPSHLKSLSSSLVLIPLCGLVLLSILGAYIIGFNVQIQYLAPALLIISIVGFLTLYFLRNESLRLVMGEWRSQFAPTIISCSLVVTPITLCLLIPLLQFDYPTSVYRIGPDMASYAKMAQFFIDGGTLVDASKRTWEFTGMSPGDINRYADATLTWPEMFYFRWGLTAFQCVVATITFTKHSFETCFASLAITYLLMGGVMWIWFKNAFKLSSAVSLLGAIAFIFNANLLNLWYEGFYGNSFALVFFALILYLFVHHRSNDSIPKSDAIRSILFSGCLIAASLASYAEGLAFVLPVFMGFTFLADIIYNRRLKWTSYFTLIYSGLIGLAIVLPCDFILKWGYLAFKQLTEEGGNGFMQPLWALPSEIFSLQNIYLNITISLTGSPFTRPVLDVAMVFIFSCFILYSIVVYLRANKIPGNALYIASMAMVLWAGFYVLYKSPHNNYTFMKMYVFHLPFLFAIFWGSLGSLYESEATKKLNIMAGVLLHFFCILICISGIVYIVQYTQEETPIEKSRIALHEEIKNAKLDNVILLPATPSSGYNKIMYPAVLPVPWVMVDGWKGKDYFKNFLKHRVFLFIEKLPERKYIYNVENIVFENERYLIIDTGHTISDGLDEMNTVVDFDAYITQAFEQVATSRQEHNVAIGLPADFSPANYLRLNPQVLDSLDKIGFHEKEQLMTGSESHFASVGSRQGLKYK